MTDIIHKTTQDPVSAAAKLLKKQMRFMPEVAVILGSGLGGVVDALEEHGRIRYEDLPDFPAATAPGHGGYLIWGRFRACNLLLFQGRYHFYEGYDVSHTILPVRLCAALGIKKLVLTNAAGGLIDGMCPGDLMLIEDHLSFFAPGPLIGPNDLSIGPRFPDMGDVYCASWRRALMQAAAREGLKLHRGVYAYMKGPQYETPAEIRALRVLGASAVGMSTVPEAIAAAHAGIKVLGISCITNLAAGLNEQRLSHEDVLCVSGQIGALALKVLALALESRPER